MKKLFTIEKAPLFESLQELEASVQKGYSVLRADDPYPYGGNGSLSVSLIPSF